MPDMTALLNAINAAESNSYGSDEDGELSSQRATSIDLYLGKNLWPTPEGRSNVLDRSVYETIQWILPSLCRIFCSGDEVVSLPPVGPEDEAPAKQESEYLNWLITQKNDWFNICLELFQDALTTKNAYALARREQRVMYELERYEKQTAEGLALLLSDGEIKITESKAYPDPDHKPEPLPPQPIPGPDGQPMIGPDGQPVMGPQQMSQPEMLYDVVLRRTTKDKTVRIYVLPPERVKVHQNTPSWKLAECPYFEWWEECTISSLRQQGFEVDDDVGYDENGDTLEDSARDQFGEDRDDLNNDPSMRRVKARFVWIRHDYDEDGIAEMQYCVVVGQDILFREECTRIPAACIVPNPLPHRHMGLSITDVVGDLQAIKTVILRQGLDNLYLSNNPQKVVSNDRVNLDDAMISRPGGITRVDGDVQTAIMYQVPPFVFPQAMEGMEYMDQVRENRTGTNRYFTGIDQNAMNKTATGIQQLSTMAAQRVEQIARIFASGIEDLFSVVHELVLRGGHKKEVIKLRNEWVEVDPASWRRRTDFKISVGFAAGNKDAMVNRLMMIADLQGKALAAGLPIVDANNMYQTALELTKASDFTSPNRFWTDPAGAQPQPAKPDPMIEAEKIKAETTVVTKKAEIESDTRQHAEDLMLEKYKVDKQAETDITIAFAKMQHEGQMEVQRQQAAIDGIGHKVEADTYMAQVHSQLDPKTKELGIREAEATSQDKLASVVKEMQQLVGELATAVQKAVTAPRELVRDKAGRPVGSRVVTE